jgi:6-phosphogluconolactonase
MKFEKISSIDPVVVYLAKTIQEHLKLNEKVTLLVTGGSAIAVAAEVSNKLRGKNLDNLYVALTDERFVDQDDADSNWKQLNEAGFDLQSAHLYPVLNGQDISHTSSHFSEILHELLDSPGYKIGLFGMGSDGHIAALFPHHPLVNEVHNYASWLEDSPKPPPMRVSMTTAAIKKLDEAVLFVRGKEKKLLLERLRSDVPATIQPAQILKSLPKLTIFNDQIGEEA